MTDAYIGSEIGALKGLNFEQNAFHNVNLISSLERSHEISCMSFIDATKIGNDKFDNSGAAASSIEESVLCALVNRQLKLYDPSTGSFSTLFKCEGGEGNIKGVHGLANGKIVTCIESGEVNVWSDDSFQKTLEINAGKDVCRMRGSPFKSNAIGTGGRENPLKVWDLEKPNEPVFVAKNVKNDWLDLRVPVWDTDLRFVPNGECVITCTAHKHIRLYDPRNGQRRPAVQVVWGDNAFTSISLTPRENQVVAANSQGCVALFDLRGKSETKLVHSFKGFAGSVSSVECHPTQPLVASCGVDRFARLHHLFTKQQLNKIYCKSRLNCLLLKNDLSIIRSGKFNRGDKNDASDEETYLSSDAEHDGDVEEVWDRMGTVKDNKRARQSSSDEESEKDIKTRTESVPKFRKNVKKIRTTSSKLPPAKRSSTPPGSPKPKKKMKILSTQNPSGKLGKRKSEEAGSETVSSRKRTKNVTGTK